MRHSKLSIFNFGHVVAFLTGMLTTLAMVGFVLHRPMVNQAMHQWSKRADAPSGEDILQFGNPGPVVDLLKRQEYVSSYDRRLRLPHWVGEHLTAESLTAHPDVDRSNSSFHEDDDLPKIFRAHLKDYSKSGYDRGHMAPAGDAVQTQEAMDETFLLSNMAPQVGIGFNRHYWSYVEGFVRDLTQNFTDVYVYTGPLFLPQSMDDATKYYLNQEDAGDKNPGYQITYPLLGTVPNVAVPTHFYKIILAPVGSDYAMAAFVLPNQKIDSKTALTDFKVDLQSIERASGLLFFEKLDRSKFKDLCTQTTCKT